MVKILKKINILMDGRQKRQMVGLFCMMAVSAFLETGAVMMVMAVVEMIIDPDTLAQGETYQKVCEILHLNGTVEFSVLAILFLIFLYIAKNSFQFFLQKRPVSFCVYQSVPYGGKPDEEFCKERL